VVASALLMVIKSLFIQNLNPMERIEFFHVSINLI